MNIPFTTEEFMRVLVEYNDAVWPMQFVLVGLTAAIIAITGVAQSQ